MSDGWEASARAWIERQEDRRDFAREYILDAPMLARAQGHALALDIGCGEGRFCRKLKAQGMRVVGIDPTEALLDEARRRDPGGDYRLAAAEKLPFPDAAFDLVVSYLTLIDIADLKAATAEMARVLSPGGALLIANLTSFMTAAMPEGWKTDADGQERFSFDNYLDEWSEWTEWDGIRILNWHRPLSTYMTLLIESGLVLRHFDEPVPYGGDAATIEHYRRAPYFLIMEWQKPPAGG